MIIIGIDPGSVLTGYAIIKKEKSGGENCMEVIDFGCINTDKFYSTGDRLKLLYMEINKLIIEHKPNIMAVESIFFFKNLKTVMPVSQAKGVILLAAAEKKIKTYEFTPLQMKMAIAGYGRADKKQVQKMIERTLDLSAFDIKKNYRKKDDAFDALGIAICASLKKY